MTDLRFLLKNLEVEKVKLDEKIMKLLKFYDEADFAELSVPDKQLIMRQGVAMEEYSQCLGYRMSRMRKKMEVENGKTPD